MTYDLGDVISLGITIRNSAGDFADATSVACTITLPDGTTASGTVAHPSTGSYTCDYTPASTGSYLVRWVATGSNAGAYSDSFTIRRASSSSLVSLAEARAHLNFPSTATSDDDELRWVIDEAHSLCEHEVEGPLVRTTFTETYDGTDSVILLDKTPVISVASVTVGGIILASSMYTVTKNGVLSSLGTPFSSLPSPVIVVYDAGYTDPPAVAKGAVLEAVRHLWATQRGSMPALPRSLEGDAFIPGAANTLTWRIRELLNPLRQKAI